MLDWIDAVGKDLKFAARQLRRSPSFTAGAIAAFALGIGANATMFNVLDRLLLRPPPHVRDANELYTIRIPTRAHVPGGATSFPIFAALHDQLAGVSSVSMQTLVSPIPVGRGTTATLAQAVFVDGGYFRTLGVMAVRGRMLGDDDARLPDGQPVVVIGDGFWRRHFGADPTVIGHDVQIGTMHARVIGIAPPGFNGLGLKPIDMWLPVTMAPSFLFVGPNWATSNLDIWLFAFARVPPATTVAQMESRATAAFLTVPRRGASSGTLGSVELRSILPTRAGQLSPEARVASMLGAVSLLVLMIACANAANLMLARAVQRRREVAVRIALGGSNRRIALLFITDAFVLAGLGGLAALLVAAFGSAVMRSVLLSGYAWNGTLVDSHTILFIGITVFMAAVMTGAIPVLLLRRFDLPSAIGEARHAGGAHRHHTISALVVTQTVLSVALLIGAVLFVRSLHNVRAVPLGVDVEHTAVLSIDAKGLRLSNTRSDALFAELATLTARIPGVSRVAIADGFPFGSETRSALRVPGIDRDNPAIEHGVSVSAVSSGYFETIGTPIVSGREFTPAEDRTDGERLTVISERLAKLLWPSATAIGQCIRLGADSLPCRRVIGVAQDAHASGIIEDGLPTPHVYMPLSQSDRDIDRVILMRTMNVERVAPLLRSAIQTFDQNLPYPSVWTLASRLDPELRPWRLGATMFGAFGVLSLALAAVGLFSVVAYSVTQRRQEMGIRIALGAGRLQILSLVTREGGQLAVIGAVLGVALAAGFAPIIQPLLFGMSARSLTVYALVAIAMTAVAFFACVIPAISASRTSPMIAIRSE